MEIVEGLYVVAEGSLSASTNQLQSHTSLLHLTYYREFLCFESYHSSTKEPNIRHGKLIILSLDYCRILQTTASELFYMDLNSTIIDLLMDNHKKKTRLRYWGLVKAQEEDETTDMSVRYLHHSILRRTHWQIVNAAAHSRLSHSQL